MLPYTLVVLWAHCLTSAQRQRTSTCNLFVFLELTAGLRRNDKYLYMGGPLLAGVTVVALSSLAPMMLPLGMRSLAVAESISLYGGLAVFGGFVLYE